MDRHAKDHMEAWLKRFVEEDERDAVRAQILALITDEPALIETHTWDEIRNLAEYHKGV